MSTICLHTGSPLRLAWYARERKWSRHVPLWYVSVCAPSHTIHSTPYVCLCSLFRVTTRQKQTNKKKPWGTSQQTHRALADTSWNICVHLCERKKAKVDKNHSETKTQLNTWRVDRAAGLSGGFHSECATIGWSGWILQHKLITTLNFCSAWPSSLGQALPPFVALGPLWQRTDSLRCINPSDTGWMDSCWPDAPCHFVRCHLIRPSQFALSPPPHLLSFPCPCSLGPGPVGHQRQG